MVGSSPLARGTLHPGRTDVPRQRFIPARAGNTGAHRNLACPVPVHPRSRGEHLEYVAGPLPYHGSSPLARGTHHRPEVRLDGVRFIPARAGNTRSRRGARSPSPVHPRSRGEHTEAQRDSRDESGSSPLARGTLVDRAGRQPPLRFIPARAGNTRRRGRIAGSAAVHPRSRGEHLRRECLGAGGAGSSPLARGTPDGMEAGGFRHRFIPARAGNTEIDPPFRRS